MPELSVIVPVYNVEKYLEQCLDSILSQTFSDFELILVDDGSSDGSGAICDEYAEKDRRVSVIHRSNAGQAAARNAGAAAAKSGLLCFIDSDDAAHPSMLELFYREVEENGAGAATCDRVRGAEVPDGFCDPVEPRSEITDIDERTLLEMLEEDSTAYWTLFPCLIKKSVYEKYPLTPGRVMEDNASACKWLVGAKRVSVIRAPLYFYRENPTGTMSAPFSPKKLDFLWALEEQMAFYKELGYSRMLGRIAERYVENAVWMAGRLENELGDRGTAKRALRNAERVIGEYEKDIELSVSARNKLYKARHPLLHKVGKHISGRPGRHGGKIGG